MTEEDEKVIEELIDRLGVAGEVSAEAPINAALQYLHVATRAEERVANAICTAMAHIIHDTIEYYEAVEASAKATKH